MNHNSVAASVRKQKEAHPERFCAVKGCLWNISRMPCRKHPLPMHTGGATAVQPREGAVGEAK